MTQVGLTELLAAATSRGTGLGAFNVISLEHAEALVSGAGGPGRQWCCRSPRTRSAITEPGAHRTRHPRYRQGLDRGRSSTSTTPPGRDLVTEAVELGFSSVMYDGLGLDTTTMWPPRPR